jgi:hypothetical protein
VHLICSGLSDRFNERKERAQHGRLRTQAETEATKKTAKVAATAEEKDNEDRKKKSAQME